jgi:hypothetical protein
MLLSDYDKAKDGIDAKHVWDWKNRKKSSDMSEIKVYDMSLQETLCVERIISSHI